MAQQRRKSSGVPPNPDGSPHPLAQQSMQQRVPSNPNVSGYVSTPVLQQQRVPSNPNIAAPFSGGSQPPQAHMQHQRVPSNPNIAMMQQQQQQQQQQFAAPSPAMHFPPHSSHIQQYPQQQPHTQPLAFPQVQHFPVAPGDAVPHQQQYTPQVPLSGNAPRRAATIRRAVEIYDGKLVVNLEVSPLLYDPQYHKYSSGEEFTKLRYTAVTCDANDFVASGYQLRQSQMGRQTELFIVVTMYNEDSILFTRTMQAINRNIQHMCNKKGGTFGGEHGWQKIVVCIVSDGRAKINKDVVNVLGAMGCYQEGVTVPRFMNKDTEAHIFEFTSQVDISDKMEARNFRQNGVVPVQILFCLKEKNKKKINSHRWFFNAFAPLLQPNVCVLVDVGTKPRRESIYRLWRCFDVDANVGGACGEIAVEYNSIFHLITPIIAAQNFEYKMSNILDKPLESVAGYISVLPGAFSAYRYKALQGRPLEQYFKGEALHESSDVFAANMYLAEDRILCFELVAKRNESWILQYEKSSQAITDVPDNFPEFISQRRRWLNGSTFALLYALGNVTQIYSSGHSFLRLITLTFEFIYMGLSFVFSYFALANFYLAYYLLSTGFVDVMMSPDSTADGKNALWGFPKNDTVKEVVKTVLGVLRSVYILSICTTFISALGNRPQGARYIYLFAIWLFAIITGVMFYMIVVTTAQDLPVIRGNSVKLGNTSMARFIKTTVALGVTYGSYFLTSFLYGEPWHMFTCFIQYMFLLPTYVNVLQIYAYCNISDVSWGTKGDNNAGVGTGVQVKTGADGVATADVELPSQHPVDVYNAYGSRLKALNDVAKSLQAKGKKAKTTLSSDDYFKQFRTVWLLVWIIFNGSLVSILVAPNVMGLGSFSLASSYLTGLFFAIAIFSLIRLFGSIMYLVTRGLCCCCQSRGKSSY